MITKSMKVPNNANKYDYRNDWCDDKNDDDHDNIQKNHIHDKDINNNNDEYNDNKHYSILIPMIRLTSMMTMRWMTKIMTVDYSTLLLLLITIIIMNNRIEIVIYFYVSLMY